MLLLVKNDKVMIVQARQQVLSREGVVLEQLSRKGLGFVETFTRSISSEHDD